MSFINMLEARHFGRLSNDAVLATAEKYNNFCNEWLIHTLRSAVSVDEIVLASAYAIHWQCPALEQIQTYLSTDSQDTVNPDTVNSEIRGAIKRHETRCSKVSKSDLTILASDILEFTRQTTKKVSVADHISTTQTKISKQMTDVLRLKITPQLKEATLFGDDGPGSEDASIRNNSQFLSPLPNNSIELAILERLTANTVGMSIQYAEPAVVLRYLPGQYYKWHFDHIFPHNDQIAAEIAQHGQRVKTGLVNLNEGFVGGETEFKEPYHQVSATHGQIITFDNVDSNGERLIASLHRGCEIVSGEKWVMTLWFRDKPFWLRNSLMTF